MGLTQLGDFWGAERPKNRPILLVPKTREAHHNAPLCLLALLGYFREFSRVRFPIMVNLSIQRVKVKRV